MVALAISVSVILTFAIAIISVRASMPEDQPLILPDNSIEFDVPHEWIYRQKWGGKPSLQTTALQHPVDLVIVVHTATGFCSTLAECSKIVAAAQKYHFRSGMQDISYNFLIGGDGNIYVGRGWDSVNSQRNQSVSVSFIGNYLRDYLTEDMADALQELLNEGVDLGKLTPDYRMVCHNQTVATLSPGVNVYEIVKNWSHFQPGTLK